MGFAVRSLTVERLREPLVATGSPDRRFDRYVISVSSFTPASTRGSIGRRLEPASLPRVIVTHASRAIPALDPAPPVDCTADANDRLAIRVHGTVARLTFGAGHGCVTDRWTRHGSTPKRHVTKYHTETAPAATGWRRYVSPLFIIAHTVRAILLASATAASLRGRRCSRFSSHSLACLLPGLSANLITAVAPVTSNWRNRSLPARLMPPMRCLPAVECSFGVRPIQAAR